MTVELNVQNITAQSAGTLIVGPDDPATLIINLDDINTVYLHNGTAFASTDQNGIFPLAPGMALVVDPSEVNEGLSLYAVTATGKTVSLGLVPGGVHFFQPFSRITIPSGATVGQRIVIDGATGTITMYNSANVVTGVWSASAQSIQIGTSTKYVKLVETGTAAEIHLNPDSTICNDGVISTTNPGGTTATLDMLSPDVISNGGPQASLSLISGDGVENPVVVTGSKLGTTGTSFQSNNFIYSSGNSEDPVPSNVTLGVAPSGDIVCASAGIFAEPNRAYKITASWSGVLPGGTQANNHYLFRIKRGATVIMSMNINATAINTTQCGGTLVAPPDTPVTSGPPAPIIYDFTVAHTVGTDSSTLVVPAFVLAEGWQ